MVLVEDCTAQGREARYAIVNDRDDTWFDFDCNYCTGAWDNASRTGLFHRIWNVPTSTTLAVPAAAAVVGPSGPRILAMGPNPTRDAERLSFMLASAGRAEVAVYDIEGRLVRRLLDVRLTAGPHDAVWDGRDDAGARVGPGLYVWRVRSGGKQAASKSIQLR